MRPKSVWNLRCIKELWGWLSIWEFWAVRMKGRIKRDLVFFCQVSLTPHLFGKPTLSRFQVEKIIGPSHSDSKKDGKWEKNENETELNDDPNMAKLSHSVFIWKSMYFGKTHLCSTFRKSLLKEKQSLWLKFEACLLGRDEIYHCEDMCKGTCEDTHKDYISCFSQEPC